MAIVKINSRSFYNTLSSATRPRLEAAGKGIEEDLIKAFTDEAEAVGALSLSHRNLYDTDMNVGRGFLSGKTDKALQVGLHYSEVNLQLPIGSQPEYPYNHTSPKGDHPKNYRWLVNSGHAGSLFRDHMPAWNGQGGWWRRGEAKMPTIVYNNLGVNGLL